ncbi:hypothetical protein OERS_34890 [Oerskovia enterophila]|uniref:Uncharacterized protein n=1 Tax=Oerskovia enterophila TaxID=43678 RepID=A0ABX2Y4E9_9CELL|nr:hypothetical protein OERS_34890 [Oerskovia enterophila]
MAGGRAGLRSAVCRGPGRAAGLSIVENLEGPVIQRMTGPSRFCDGRAQACGASAAIIGSSFSIMPIFAAPPGDPRSSKNSTFAR